MCYNEFNKSAFGIHSHRRNNMKPESIGKNIRDARRRIEMTQAVLAHRMNVTESAVSQWENGRTLPDPTMVPDLCAVLNVSADWLLCVDAEKRAFEIREILKQVDNLSRNGRRKETLPILEDAYLHYPESNEIAAALMSTTEDLDRKIAIGERLLAECTDAGYRTSAMQTLIYTYKEKGNLCRAEELARQMPGLWTTSDVFLTHIAEGEKYRKQAQILRFQLLNLLYEAMHYGIVYGDDETEASYNDDERAEVAKKCIALFELFFEDGDYAFHHGSLEEEYLDLAAWHAQKGEVEDALFCLEKAADHALAFIEYTESERGSYRHTSLLFRGATGGGDVGLGSEQNSASDVLDRMKRPDFDSLRETPAFREIEGRLTEAAGPWHVAGT